jgi:RNA polymerase primary sigma factor
VAEVTVAPKKAAQGEGDEPAIEEIDLEAELVVALEEVVNEEVVTEEPAALVEAAQADAEADDDFQWDDEESEALKPGVG